MKKYILYIVAILAGALVSTPVFAETMKSEVNIKPSMTLDVPTSSVNLDLDPAIKPFDSEDVNITVGTNNKTGYWISMSSSTGESDLVNIDDNTKTIPTIATAGSYTSSDFPINQWGYKIDSGNYIPFVSGATIKSSNTTANGETFKLNIASKIDYLQPSGTYNIALNIKMLPNMTTNYIQNLDPTLCTEDPMVVIDNRDEQPYIVQRLKDGKCWMMTNLNLGAVKLTQDLTSANTNINDNSTISADDFNSYNTGAPTFNHTNPVYTPLNSNNTSNHLSIDPVSQNPYGTVYNYCITTAKTICTSSNNNDATSDICPSGWRLPTSGKTSGDFYELFTNPNYNSVAKIRAPISNNGAAFALSGRFNASHPNYPNFQGVYGDYWGSSHGTNGETDGYGTVNGTTMWGMIVYSTNMRGCVYGRSNLYAIRCVLKES